MHSVEMLDDFLALSAALTGFSTIRLRGTGQAERYLATLVEVVGEATAGELLATFRRLAETDDGAQERRLRQVVLSDAKLGPVARNLIKLWYVGTWNALPADWREAFAVTDRDRTFVVSPEAYTEGLLWPAIGANPAGAKPLGYGIWATPPRFDAL